LWLADALVNAGFNRLIFGLLPGGGKIGQPSDRTEKATKATEGATAGGRNGGC